MIKQLLPYTFILIFILRALKYHEKKFIIFFTIFQLIITNASSQTVTITGKVQDSTNNAISSATVLIKNSEDKIILFSFSDKDGEFKFHLPDSLKQLNIHIEVSAVGYVKQKKSIENSRNFYLFTLLVSYHELENVLVTARQKIKSSGDTLSYDINSFAQNEDRSIGDVIKRLPGLTVADDGSISFNGKRINNLIIQSDDLMNGKYGLATKSISKEMIDKVEVIKHYQPISILKDKVYSDDIVVNLVLKDENAIKLSGQAQIGIGLPNLVNLATNLIVLNKKIKMLNSIKYNNNGEDYRFDFKDLTSLESIYPKDLLSDAVIENPGLPNKYIYQNNSFSASANNLYNTKDSLQLRANIRYFFDRNELMYSSNTESYIQADTIVYKEQQNTRRSPYNFDAGFTIIQNKKNYYLKNLLQLNLSGYNNTGYLNFNNAGFPQAISKRLKNISNNFQWIPDLFKRDVVIFNWLINFYNAPQNLNIGTGIDSSILNNNIPYNSVRQYAEIPSYFSTFSVNYYLNNERNLQQSYQFGVENKWQKLNSLIYLTQLNGTTGNYQGDTGNDLTWRQNNYFVRANYFIKKEYWRVNLAIPIKLQQIIFNQSNYALNGNQRNLFFNPELKGEYYFNGENSIIASYIHSNSLGDAEDIYKGILIKNFRQITNNDAFIRELQSNEINLQYKMNRSIKLFFLNTAFRYKSTLLNAIPKIEYTNNVQQTIYIPLHNTQTYLTCFANVSKYVFPIKSKIGFDFGFSSQNSKQYINAQLFPLQTNSYNIGFSADCKLIDYASITYTGAANWITSKQLNSQSNLTAINSKVEVYNQIFSLIITPPKTSLFITMGGTYQLNKSPAFKKKTYFFSDVNIRFHSKKLRTDFEFNIDNLFDVKTYDIFSNTTNQLIASTFNLRGRLMMLKATFNF